jgi:hypothetical protein
MDKRYQIFVSSTYADLKEERQRVIQALMEMDCIPAGMELFPAVDEAQWDFIKRVIDDCDYYLIIIGGRYGTISSDGISYTEKEFDYANARNLKIVALIHKDPDSIPVGKSDIEPSIRKKLADFKSKVATNRLVKFWKNTDELPGLVVLSLSKTIKTYPAVGWVRAPSVASNDVLIEINDLRKENLSLRDQLAKSSENRDHSIPDLADFDEVVELHGRSMIHGSHASYWKEWKVKLSWRKIFALLSPYLMSRPEDSQFKDTLGKVIADEASAGGFINTIEDQNFRTVAIQLKALELVTIDYLETTKGGMGLFWTLTQKGEQSMIQERSIKKKGA